MTSHGRISFILDKIKHAKTPDRFTNDFLKTVIGAKSSNDRPFIGVAKRIGLLNQDGSPSEVYKKFRSTDDRVSKAAMAGAIRHGFSDIYSHNEYAHKLNDTELEGIVIQLTGLEKDNRIVSSIVKTFKAFKDYADFEVGEPAQKEQHESSPAEEYVQPQEEPTANIAPQLAMNSGNTQLGLSYQINLILPKTDDIAVFNAIFKSLKENLLDK